MKKILYLLTLALGTTTLAFAQPTPQLLPSVQFGIKGGANFGTFKTTNFLSPENRNGFLAGLWSRVGAGPWYFQPELYYNSRNADLKNNVTGNVNKVNFKSIDLPLLFGRKLALVGVTPRINTGPVISFATKQDQTINSEDNSSSLKFKSQNYGWQFGLGVDVSRLSVDARYELGLNKVKTVYYDSDVRLNTFSVTLGYRLFSL